MIERELLEEYKTCTDNNRKKELTEELRSFIVKTETEIMNRMRLDKSFRPTIQDEYSERRNLMNEIRKELKLYTRTKNQHPPENIEEIRKALHVNTENED